MTWVDDYLEQLKKCRKDRTVKKDENVKQYQKTDDEIECDDIRKYSIYNMITILESMLKKDPIPTVEMKKYAISVLTSSVLHTMYVFNTQQIKILNRILTDEDIKDFIEYYDQAYFEKYGTTFDISKENREKCQEYLLSLENWPLGLRKRKK